MSYRIPACVLMLLLTSCTSDDTLADADPSATISITKKDLAEKKPVEESVQKISNGKVPARSDQFSFPKANIKSDQLHVEVEFGGGCEDHDFTFFWDGKFTKGTPKSVEIIVIHNANSDPCEAIRTETLKVDLSEVKKAYAKDDSNDATNKLKITLTTLDGQTKDVEYQF